MYYLIPTMRLFWVLFFILIHGFLIGQNHSIFESKIFPKHFIDTIPINVENDLVFLNVEVGGKPRKFLFDTGSPFSISNDILAETHSTILDTVNLVDINQEKSKSFVIKTPIIKIGNIEIEDAIGAGTDVFKHGLLKCFEIEGVLGSNVLQNCVVTIDAKNKIMVISSSAPSIYDKQKYSCSFKIDHQGRPFISTKAITERDEVFLFDSGFTGLVKIDSSILSSIKPKITKMNEGTGMRSIGANSEMTAIKKSVYEIESINFGQLSIKKVQVSYDPDNRNKSIGAELFRYGIVQVDFRKKKFQVFFDQLIQSEDNSTDFGFDILMKENAFWVGMVMPGSSAEKLGIRSGMQIVKINGHDVSQKTDDLDCLVFLKTIFEEQNYIELLTDDGRKIEVEITKLNHNKSS